MAKRVPFEAQIGANQAVTDARFSKLAAYLRCFFASFESSPSIESISIAVGSEAGSRAILIGLRFATAPRTKRHVEIHDRGVASSASLERHSFSRKPTELTIKCWERVGQARSRSGFTKCGVDRAMRRRLWKVVERLHCQTTSMTLNPPLRYTSVVVCCIFVLIGVGCAIDAGEQLVKVSTWVDATKQRAGSIRQLVAGGKAVEAIRQVDAVSEWLPIHSTLLDEPRQRNVGAFSQPPPATYEGLSSQVQR